MIKKSWLSLSSLVCLLLVSFIGREAPRAQRARTLGTESGFGIFQQRCMSCHGSPGASERAASPSALRELSPEAIHESLTSGVMKAEGENLSDEERMRVAESVSGRLLGTATNGDAAMMPNRCSSRPTIGDPSNAPAWSGWGANRVYGLSSADGRQLVDVRDSARFSHY